MKRISLFSLLALSVSCHVSYESPLADEQCKDPTAQNCPETPKIALKHREASPEDGRFVVHEWGTFTTLVDESGKTFTWYPLLSTSPLPNFVNAQWFQTISGEWYCGKGCNFAGERKPLEGTVRMETPVIYFYSDKERELSVEVKFNNGYVTEWYPGATVPVKNPNVISWNSVRLTPNAKEDFPTEKAGSEYYAARETDATPLVSIPRKSTSQINFDKIPLDQQIAANKQRCNDESCSQQEKFLFYRGVGSFDVPLSVALVSSTEKEQKIVIKNQDTREIPGMILFSRKGDHISFSVLGNLSKGQSKPASLSLTSYSSNIEGIKDALTTLLEEQNLYGREAKAMVKTWEEAWFEDGLRVFYIVPKQTTDEILPLTLSEKPDEIERVLVGRIDILTPELRREIEGSISKLFEKGLTEETVRSLLDGHTFQKERAQNLGVLTLLSQGRFIQPLLAAAKKSSNADQQKTISALLDVLPYYSLSLHSN